MSNDLHSHVSLRRMRGPRSLGASVILPLKIIMIFASTIGNRRTYVKRFFCCFLLHIDLGTSLEESLAAVRYSHKFIVHNSRNIQKNIISVKRSKAETGKKKQRLR